MSRHTRQFRLERRCGFAERDPLSGQPGGRGYRPDVADGRHRAPRLGTVAEKIRSKNAGPFCLTIDIFCGSAEAYARVVRG
ncbi:MAG: DUF4387 family protein, partial [Pseudomonadota bacterium]